MRGSAIVCDGRPHHLALHFDQPSSTYSLLVDGKVDATASFGAPDDSPADWVVEAGTNFAAGGYVTGVAYDYFDTQPVRGLRLSGVAVQHVGWGLGREDVTDFQAVSYLSTAAVHLVDAHGCSLNDVAVQHVGGMGVWVEGGSSEVGLASCLVEDVGAGGVRVGRGQPLSNEQPGKVTHSVWVNNSKILRGSQVYQAGNGVLLQNSPNFTLTRTEVAYFNHVAVTLGWVWGFALPPATHSNRVEYNHVHHVGNGDLSDLGGIYALGVQPGTMIRCELMGLDVCDANVYGVTCVMRMCMA